MYTNRFFQLKKEAHEMLLSLMSEGQTVTLFDMENKDYCEHDEFYELPQQFLYGKYGYAIIYYLHKVYIKDGAMYVEGFETEDGDDYTFDINSLDCGNVVELADRVREELKLEPAKEAIHVGVISHRYGYNYYASKTEEGLEKQIAEYCRDWWADFCDGEAPEKDDEVIVEYFSEHNAGDVEWCEMTQTEVE